MFKINTDLALEAREMYREKNQQEIEGVIVDVEKAEEVVVTRVKIVEAHAAEIMGKPIGNYITIECRGMKKADADLKDLVSKILAKEIKKIAPQNKNIKILIVGLGNWNITPDALGPKVVDKVLVTRHLFKLYNKEQDESMAEISAISPGVMGTTGVDTSEIIMGIVENIKPDLIVAIDALASRRMQRVNTTIQLSDTGISPGSAMKSKRTALNEETVGIPVIAIGVPTVVDAATLASDTIDMAIRAFSRHAKKGTQFYRMLEELGVEEKYTLIKEVLEPHDANVIVTPTDIDDVIASFSNVIANGINIALNPGIDLKDVNRYIN
ncbi:MAG: GPR endopeptidase [Alkaliphilus sp.]